jgi:Na+/H+ antiporter NhaD/arsenite permease-like protein
MVILSAKGIGIRGNKKTVIGFTVIALLSLAVLVVPDLVGFKTTIALKLSSIVLLSVYVVLSFEMVHRTAISLLGAIIIIVIGITTGLFTATQSFDFAVNSIDFNTIGLLLGMMIIVAVLAETGIFQYIGIKIGKKSNGNLWKLLVMLTSFTAVTSMFIDNVTTVLLMVPVTISILRIFKLSPIPFILAQVIASNVGGTATLIGDPPNIMIGSAAQIDFNSFLTHMGPTIGVGLIGSLFFMKYLFKKHLAMKPHDFELLATQNESSLIHDRQLLKKSLAVLFGTIVLFVLHGMMNIEPSIIALGGAAALLTVTRAKPEKVLHEVDWSTLLFFAGLFVIISGAEEAGLIELLSNSALGVTGGDPWITFLLIIWVSAIASAFIDNIPFAATMIPLVVSLSQNEAILAEFGSFAINPLWWALALGVGLGGNGTLIGSSAGVVAIGVSEKNGYPITFNQFFKVGMPFMIFSVGLGTLVLMIDVMMRG